MSKIAKPMQAVLCISLAFGCTEKLKKAKPAIRFSSDFIIGYPGETEDDFNQTLELIEKVEFINSYSFIYSARPGTPASKLDDVEPKIAKERLIRLQTLLEEKNSNKCSVTLAKMPKRDNVSNTEQLKILI